MTIHALIGGRLFATPEQKVSASGKTYIKAKLAIEQAPDGRDPQAGPTTVWVSVTAFQYQDRWLALAKGSPVAFVGSIRLRIYTQGTEPRIAMDCIADEVLSPIGVLKRKTAFSGAREAPAPSQRLSTYDPLDDFGPLKT